MADESEVQFDAGSFRSNVEQILERIRPALVGALRAEAAKLETEANSYVPVESGELQSSSFVDAGTTERGNPIATMGYEAPYAAAVHEGFHGGKQTKTPHQFWLQTSANRAAPGFVQRMAKVVSGAIG